MLNATILIVDQTGPPGADSPKALPLLPCDLPTAFLSAKLFPEGSSLLPLEPMGQGEAGAAKLVSTLAFTPALSPAERERPASAILVSGNPLPSPRFGYLLRPPPEALNRSYRLKPDDDAPSPGGEGWGEGGPNYPLTGGVMFDSRLAPPKTAENFLAHRRSRARSALLAGRLLDYRTTSLPFTRCDRRPVGLPFGCGSAALCRGNIAPTGSRPDRGLAIRRGLTVRNYDDYQLVTSPVANLRYELVAHEPGRSRALTGL